MVGMPHFLCPYQTYIYFMRRDKMLLNNGSRRRVAFALIGDRYHNSDYIRTALKKTLVEKAGISIDFTDEVSLLSEETLKYYRMLIILRDGMVWPNGYGITDDIVSDPPLPKIEEKPEMWMTPNQGRAVREFVDDGGAALFLHNSSHISLSNHDFRNVLGGAFIGHPPVRPFKIKMVNREHPITRGVQDFIITDEQHYVKYEKDQGYVFMISVNENGLTFGDYGSSCEAGWAYEYGKGKVCFMAPGHNLASLWNPEYVKLQVNAVKWLLKKI